MPIPVYIRRMPKYDTLIFDIGNVIVDIDYIRPVAEFQKLTAVDFAEIASYNRDHKLFDTYEKGKLTEAAFHGELRRFLRPGVTDQEILDAWNSILIAYPEHKLQLLQQLKANYRVLALSNINETHVRELDRVARERLGVTAFSDFFHKAYYSHEMGLRKPEKEIYQEVLRAENLNPARTFFVDDLAENVASALQVGLDAYQLTERDHLKQLLQQAEIV